MLQKTSILGIVGAAIISVGLGTLLATILGGSAVGFLAFIVLTGASVWGIETYLVKPMRQLANSAAKMDQLLSGSTANLPIPVQPKVGTELIQLASGLQNAGNTFGQRLAELDSIHAISQTITSSTLDYEKTVKSVLAAVQKVVDYDAAEVAILNGRHLIVEAWWGKEGFTDTTGRKYSVGKGPTGTIAATKEPLFLPIVKPSEDLQRTIGFASVEIELVSKTTKLVINSFLGIPLLIGDRLIGTLTLVHHEPEFFTEDDMRQLNKLADHASIAIDNALQVRQREQELRNQIQELRIEIDRSRVSEQIEEVTSSDFFRHLQDNAAKMRERYANRAQQSSADKDRSGEGPPASQAYSDENIAKNENDASEDA